MKSFLLILTLTNICAVHAADSVEVVFRYTITGHTGISVPGTFNGWNNTAWPMTNAGGNLYVRTARLATGMYEYKFYYSGASPWPNDPLNHHVDAADNSNSVLYVRDPTIYHFLPNQRSGLVGTTTPEISAYLFPKVGSVIDTAALALTIDGATYGHIGSSYDFASQQLNYLSPPLPNGSHTVILAAGGNLDTVTFTTQGGFVRFLNQSPFTTWKTNWTLNGTVDDSTVVLVRIVRNSIDTFTVAVSNTNFTYNAPLIEGSNVFVALADSAGDVKLSSPVTFIRRINHAPSGLIRSGSVQDSIQTSLTAAGSTDPDSGQSNALAYVWSVDPNNPSFVTGVDGATTVGVSFPKPAFSGEYYFSLIVTDPDGNKDTTRNYLTVNRDGSISFPTIASNPDWAQKARVYFLFPKAASAVGTIAAAAQRLQNIKDLGFSVVWMMPVMRNAFPINNGVGPGYNIVDFYNVAPEYGTNQDFKNFVAQAHGLGLKVILDVTPNHTSRFHPWSEDAHNFKTNSPYWNWYQHAFIPHNDNGLGQSADADNFWYYSGFSDQLLNFNWADVDARSEMINVYTYWMREFGLDGYRFDVYWGPHRRYGEQYMGKPVRDALKHVKPDILLLAEDDGTGPGTETIYADHLTNGINGGVDASYDFKLYRNQVAHFGFSSVAINNLHNEIDNVGYYPGRNSLYMRFMESQDEDRIVFNYSNDFGIDSITTFKRTMPMASVLFTAPGFPMIWNGQEVGWGYGITTGTLERNRSVIDWNYPGKSLLSPHYQKLAHIRAQFQAFTQHKQDTNVDGVINSSDTPDFVRVPSSNGLVYAFTRPFDNQNGLTVVNFSALAQTAVLNLGAAGALKLAPMVSYFLNNLYANAHEQVSGPQLDSVVVTLPPFGSALYTVSLTQDSVTIVNPIAAVVESDRVPSTFSLAQNYPNPFNPTTTIQYDVPKTDFVTLRVYNIIGQEMSTVVNELRQPGRYRVEWDAQSKPSGVYFYQLATSSSRLVRKMLLIR